MPIATVPASVLSFSRRSLLAAAGMALPGARASAQDSWPSRPIRFVNPGPAGGAGDVLARLLGERLGLRLGQPVVIEDRPGAGTNIGMSNVARSAPDGYTVGLGSIASNAVNKWLYRNLPFDPEKDFLPVTTVAEFLDYARKHSGGINDGSVGAGSSQHLVGAQFALTTGIEMQHVPYNASGQLNTDMMEGRVQVLFQSISAVSEMAKSGRMPPLAVTGTERQPAFPELPTLREARVDVTATGWFGMVTPAGVPEPVLERLNREVVACLNEPALRALRGARRRAQAKHAGGVRAAHGGRDRPLARGGQGHRRHGELRLPSPARCWNGAPASL
jgi:tripartite-type tricarboxylate transporter receptor subunit TctC